MYEPSENGCDSTDADSVSDASPEPDQGGCDVNKAAAVSEDDGRRRVRIEEPLRSYAAQLRLRLEKVNAIMLTSHKRKRETTSKKKKGVNKGPGKYKRDISLPVDRPRLLVVGDGEFTSIPECNEIVSTIKLLTLENMPGPCRTYNAFPIQTRFDILTEFLKRYSWDKDEDELRCIDVFERIAFDAYGRALTMARRACRKKYGLEKQLWKNLPPRGCTNLANWAGLCDIWSTKAWEEQASTNLANRTKSGAGPTYMGGSRSMHRTRVAMEKELGSGSYVGPKAVYDRTHTKETEEGRVYVNPKAAAAARKYDELGKKKGEALTPEERWSKSVGGENRGRIWGFGFRSITRAGVSPKAAAAPVPSASTATSAESAQAFTRDEVAEIVRDEVGKAVGKVTETMMEKMTEQAQSYKTEIKTMQANVAASDARLLSFVSNLFQGGVVSPQATGVAGGTSKPSAPEKTIRMEHPRG